MGLLSWIFRGWTQPGYNDAWAWVPMGSQWQSDSGVPVTPETAKKLVAVWGCVRIVAETLSTLPIHLYERNGEGPGRKSKVVYDHPVAQLLRRPNNWMSGRAFRSCMQWHQELRGNAYAEIVRMRGGRPVALLPIHPDRIKIDSDSKGLLYKVRKQDGGEVIVQQRNMLHMKPLSDDGYQGQTPIASAANTIGTGLAAQKFGSRVFKSSGLKRMALKTPTQFNNNENDRQRLAHLRDSWNTAYGDSGDGELQGQHRVAVLHSGLEPVSVGIDPRDAQMIELLNWGVRDICRAWRIQPHKNMDLSDATFSNIEHQGIEFVTDSILPRAVTIEDAIEFALLSDEENAERRYFVKHNIDGLLRGDLKSRMEAHQVAIQNGIKSRNECRDDEDLNPYEGGDVMLVPLNMIEVGQPEPDSGAADGDVTTKAEPKAIEVRRENLRDRVKSAWFPVIWETYKRLSRREKKDIIAAVNKFEDDPARLLEWITDWATGYETAAQKVLKPTLYNFELELARAAAAEIGADVGDGMVAWMQGWAEGYGKRHAGRSVRELQKIIEGAQGVEGFEAAIDEVRRRMEDWEGRAENLARNRVTQSDGAIAREIWRREGVRELRWSAVGEDCPFCAQLDGKVVGIEQSFLPQGSKLEAEGKTPIWAGADVLHPPLHSGCDCRIEVG